jgi:ADP-ribose pyrophosphatase YjhB (NUDIX family)
VFYSLLKRCVGIFFNVLNVCLAGNLPPFGCVCVIVEEQGRFLLFKRSKHNYTLPGGFMRWREHPVQAAKREAEEETGLRLRIGDVVCYSSNINTQFDHMNTLTIIFAGEVVGGELRRSVEGQPCWVEEAQAYSRLGPRYQDIFEGYQRYRAQRTKMEVSTF